MIAALLASVVVALPGGPTAEAKRIAARTFPPPCHVEVVYRPLKGAVAGRALRRGRSCRVLIDSTRRWRWAWLCTTIVHEYGHLAGREHSRNPRSVMYPRIRRVFHRCKGRW